MGRCSEIFMERCVKCKGKYKPYIVRVEGMYYVRCGCGKWDRYWFLGLKPTSAIEEWNKYNRPIRRGRMREIDNLEC